MSGLTCTGGVCGGGSTTNCDDGNLCTVDTCDSVNGCVHTGTPVAPGSCLDAGKTQLFVVNSTNKTQLKWQWKKGQQPVPNTALGSPDSSTDYSLCIYDESGAAPYLVASYTVPGGSASWSVKGITAKFSDKAGSNDGITSIKAKASPDVGSSSISLKASGSSLVLPAPIDTGDPGQYFKQNPAMIAQMLNSAGTCWSTTFNPDITKKNTATEYKAVGP
jgi:hypothetical protein